MDSLVNFASPLTDALFPPACPACRADTGEGQTLCPDCWAETAFLTGRGCSACGREVPGLGIRDTSFRCDTCQKYPPAWDRGAAVFAYEGTGRRLVLGLKHGDRLDMLPMLAGWMLRAGREFVSQADLILPVPMHWSRRFRRRFNQSAELARTLVHALDTSAEHRAAVETTRFVPNLLRRSRWTASQDGRDRAARMANVEAAFSLAPGAEAQLENRRVLLVDDVLTTGATLNACARICRQGGAESVDIVVLALVSFDEAPYLRDP